MTTMDEKIVVHSVFADESIPNDKLSDKRSIHSSESIKFYQEELKADDWVLSVLKDKYKIPFTSNPGPYYEPNNKSAVNHKQFLWEKMTEWENGGFVLRQEKRPYCCNPMTVAEKVDHRTGKTKLCPCIDCSRHVNNFIPKLPVKLSHLSEAEKLLEHVDFQTSYDMENMYFHLGVHEEFWEYLGCEIESPEGEKVYFVFKVLIYGLKPAVHAVTKLTMPILRKAALMGIRSSIFIDDGRILAKTVEEGKENFKKMTLLIEKAGWSINWSKTIDIPSQSLYHQGLITCTNPLMYILPDFKIAKLNELLQDVLKCYSNSETINCKQLAKVIGSVVSCNKALGPLSSVLLRSSQCLLAKETNNFQDWTKTIRLTEQAAIELDLLNSSLQQLNGQPILLSHSGINFNEFIKNLGEIENAIKPSLPFNIKPEVDRKTKLFPIPLPTESVAGVWASDSSDFQEYAFSVTNPAYSHQRQMSAEETELSSGLRELGSVSNSVWDYRNSLYSSEPSLLYWLTDSQNLCSWLERGSSKPWVQVEVVKLFQKLSALNLHIVPIHVPREHSLLALADQGSKYLDNDDWSIDDDAFKKLQMMAEEHFTCDVFAYNTNARVTKFYSKIPSPGCSGINAFSMDWSRDFNFICPPVKEIVYVLKHILKTPCRGVLVIPSWPTVSFWNKITVDGNHLLPMFTKRQFFRPYLYKGKYCDNNIFDGYATFPFLGLVFDSSVTIWTKPLQAYCINGD